MEAWQHLYIKKIKFTFKEKIRFSCEIAYGVHYLHSLRPRIIHRDLKPDNILLDDSFTVKIADFGMSKMIQKYSKTMTSSGTPHYMSPESIDKGKYSEKSDVYSFGVILWELYTEKSPFEEMNQFRVMYLVVNENLKPEVPEDCPKNFGDIINSCLQFEPENRPDFKMLINSLENININTSNESNESNEPNEPNEPEPNTDNNNKT